MIEIDGSAGEGGGQVLRSALALSLCTRQPVKLRGIRARRPRPGLMRQHLACVNAAMQVSGAKAWGAELGSCELVFEPGPVRPGDYSFSVGTAGSCCLVFQTVLPALMVASGPSRLLLGGGTHNPMAPPFHFVQRCFAPLLARLGVGIDLQLRRLGFHPAGGGVFAAEVAPPAAQLQPFDLDSRGPLLDTYVECFAPGLPARVVQRELDTIGAGLGLLADQLRAPAARSNEGPGNALLVTVLHEHVGEVVTAFGEKGVTSEAVAEVAISGVRAYMDSAGALGPHLADQWMLPLALAVSRTGTPASFTCTDLTLHATTNMGVIEAFLPVAFDAVQHGPASWQVSVSHRLLPGT